MTFLCQFCKYTYKRLLLGTTPAGNMFQRKIDEIFKELPSVFGIADNILIEGCDNNGKEHDRTLCWALQIQRNKIQKLNWDICYFRCTSVPIFTRLFLDKVRDQIQDSWWHSQACYLLCQKRICRHSWE